jgi:glycerol uptake facilitator protein
MSPYLAEFLGTLLIIVIGNGFVAGTLLKDTKSENSGWLAVTIAWGLAVTLAIYASTNFSKAHLNPAVTFAFAFHGLFPWDQVPGYIFSQTAGAFVGSVIVFFHYYPHFKRSAEPELKLAVFSTGPAVRNTFFNLLSETVATCVLVLGLYFIGINKFAEGLNPIVVGLLIVGIGLGLGGTTGFAINPARDFGPRLAHALLPIPGKGSSDWSYSWIPVIGPILGGLLATALYEFMTR